MDLDVLIVRDHRTGKTMYDQYLRWQVIRLRQVCQVVGDKIHIGRVHGPDNLTRLLASFHGELRVNTQMDVWHFKILFQLGYLSLYIAKADLDIQEDQGIDPGSDMQDRIYLLERHTQPVFSILARRTLSCYGDISIGFLPFL